MKGRSICKGLLCAYFITVVFLFLLAFFLFQFDLGEKIVRGGIVFIYLLSCFIGGYITGKRVGQQKYLWGALLGVCYCLVLFLVSLVMSQDSGVDIINMATTLALCLGGGMLGGMLA